VSEAETINIKLASQPLNRMLSAMWNMELWNSQSGTSVAQIYSGTSYYATLTIGPIRQAHSGAFALADDVID
jgi:hypothetical protein